MKNLRIKECSILFVFTLLVMSCSEEVPEVQSLDVEILKDHFPFTEYANSEKVVFIHESGNERAFLIEQKSAISSFDTMGVRFEGENEEFTLIPDNESNNFPTTTSFKLELSSTYIDEDVVKQILINQFIEDTAQFTMTLDSTGMPNNGTVQNLTILYYFYQGVSTSSNVLTFNLEAGFYFNEKLGLIGYIDENENLWLFERFE